MNSCNCNGNCGCGSNCGCGDSCNCGASCTHNKTGNKEFKKTNCKDNGFVFRLEYVPASLGDDVTGTIKPKNGNYTNAYVVYEANGAQYIYDSYGAYTQLPFNAKKSDCILWTRIGKSSYYSRDNGYVSVNISEQGVNLPANTETLLFTLPEDVRPTIELRDSVVVYDEDIIESGVVKITTDGKVLFTAMGEATDIYGAIMFYTGGRNGD